MTTPIDTRSTRTRVSSRALLWAAPVLLLTIAAACAAPQPSGEVRLSLVAYSTPREVYAQLIKAFQTTPAGAGVEFDESYGGSTEQSLAVRNGLPADIVALSLDPDVASLVQAGLVGADWNQTATHGMVTDSVVALAVRKGNPLGIQDWSDIVKPGVEVITPNPFTSGGARWDIVAAYGAKLRSGKSAEQAADYLRSLFAHVPVQGKSAREALQAFVGGKGDVLISYENEAILAQAQGQPIDYVVPNDTILVENPIAVTSSSNHPVEARAFIDFVLSPEGQRIFGEAGYRPVIQSVASELFPTFPEPSRLFTIDDLGGWPSMERSLFDRQSGLVASLFASQGISQDGN